MGKKDLKANCLFGARYMLSQVEALQGEIQGALLGEDIEHVHQMRVASRRMRNGLNLFQDCFAKNTGKAWQDEIRTITKALGNARDLDIQIDLLNRCYAQGLEERLKPGYNRLLLRLKQRRTDGQIKVQRTLESLQQRGILNRMEKQLKAYTAGADHVYLFTPSLYQQAYKAIGSSLEEFLGFQVYIHDPENIEELHAMRIAGKHLRYTIEIFAPIYGNTLDPHIQAMKGVQDLLGEIHDNDVWIAWLPKFIEKEEARVEDYFGNKGPFRRLRPGFNHFFEDRQQMRDQDYQSFLATWEKLQSKGFWSGLTEIIKAPINIEAALAHLSANSEDLPDAAILASDESDPDEGIKPDIQALSGPMDEIDPVDQPNQDTSFEV